MNRNSLTNSRARLFALRPGAFFLIILCLSLQPAASLAQTNVLTKAQFSRFSVVERARFFEPTISRIAAEEAVDPYLLWTIAYNETRFRPWLRSYAGAEGLMQFIPSTALRFGLFNPYQPEPAIRAAALYVRFLSNRFGGRIDSILAGYNAGEGAVDAFLTGKTIRANGKIINGRGIKTVGGVPPYQETIGYVARGLVVYRLLKARQMFSGSFVPSVYPPAVSFSVARVWLNDPEIGFNGSLLTQINNPIFLNAGLAQQNDSAALPSSDSTVQTKVPKDASVRRNATDFQTNIPVPATETVAENQANSDNEEEKTIKASDEIFYEPRTGARFKMINGKKERLADSGELVVSQQLRAASPSASVARGTFFGGSGNKASDK